MAIDKSRTSPFVKVTIVALAFMLVIGIAGPSVVSLLEAIFNPAPSTSTGTGQTGSVDASSAIATANSKYAASTKATDAALATDPKNYDLLVTQAQAYHDWANEIMQANQQQSGADRPLWLLAVDFYQKALAVKPGDPNVMTDMSIAQFYSGDSALALTTAEGVAKANPAFAPVQFNLGVFYTFDNQTAKAIAAYEAYLRIAPTGDLVTEANTRIASLKSQPAASTTTTP
jgi:tetratricopeptide (TPR) repeat protein